MVLSKKFQMNSVESSSRETRPVHSVDLGELSDKLTSVHYALRAWHSIFIWWFVFLQCGLYADSSDT